MNAVLERSYRKNLVTDGLIYINGEELQVSINNISMTGILMQLSCALDTENMFNGSLVSTVIDFYLPQLRLAGTAEIVRIHKGDVQILLALKFKDITYNIDGLLYRRKVYRKSMSVAGRILLDNDYHDFYAINVSLEGLMIRLMDTVVIVEGMITAFESNVLDLKGDVKVVWTNFDADGNTLAGLKYVNVNTSNLKGIPRFATDNN